jgi:hypothetical protein
MTAGFDPPVPPIFLHLPVTCVIRGKRLCGLLHLRTLGNEREDSDRQAVVRSQHRRFDFRGECRLDQMREENEFCDHRHITNSGFLIELFCPSETLARRSGEYATSVGLRTFSP